MNIERDKFLTELMGECWHETKQRPNHQFEYCIKCGQSGLFVTNKNDFSTWEGFGKLWTFVLFKQPFWEENAEQISTYLDDYIHPDRFANAVYKEYLKVTK